MAKILLIDDDHEVVKAVATFLSGQGHVVDGFYNGEDAEQCLKTYPYDLILLDWSLPGISGEEVCRNFRAAGGQTPIIFLTGKNDVNSLEIGFDAGADDYLTKPFDIRELNARLKGVLKRRTGAFVAQLKIQDLVLNPEDATITVDGQTVQLRGKEVALLEFLMRHPNTIYSAQQLLDSVWPADSAAAANSVRTWMNLLRQKLVLVNRGDLIRTVLGAGYIIDDRG